ncbi:hypothetical protein SL1157_1164 [Ruegeria lacuscaerulensis ITI-1157]|nr:hypothetical protein SL1157_1164 [Ruegeria lacuscaerulensis ITI-1157]SHJ85280.1 hypothetical protein SAMN05444404_2766 [Ruegeria lacuscaerulensis ITI-1157]
MVCALVLALVRAWRLDLVSMAFSLVAAGSIAQDYAPADTSCDDGCLTFYQKNLMREAWPRYELAEDIIASGARLVTLQEVSSQNPK